MTIINGVYCSLCRVRYQASFMIREQGPVCEHHVPYPTVRGISFYPQANFVYLYSWQSTNYYKKFIVQEFIFKQNENGTFTTKFDKQNFELDFVDPKQVNDLFLEHLSKISAYRWPYLVEAYVLLVRGGEGFKSPPSWRLRQLIKRHEKEDILNCKFYNKKTELCDYDSVCGPSPCTYPCSFYQKIGE